MVSRSTKTSELLGNNNNNMNSMSRTTTSAYPLRRSNIDSF